MSEHRHLPAFDEVIEEALAEDGIDFIPEDSTTHERELQTDAFTIGVTFGLAAVQTFLEAGRSLEQVDVFVNHMVSQGFARTAEVGCRREEERARASENPPAH